MSESTELHCPYCKSRRVCSMSIEEDEGYCSYAEEESSSECLDCGKHFYYIIGTIKYYKIVRRDCRANHMECDFKLVASSNIAITHLRAQGIFVYQCVSCGFKKSYTEEEAIEKGLPIY